MNDILLGAILLNVILLVACIVLLCINRQLSKKIKYVDEANMWHRLAITDDLTGVYNRTAYNLHMEKMKRGDLKGPCAIILFDIDGFKQINDTLGHFEGDKILKMVGKLLSEVFFASNYRVFRIGGDEFAVVAEHLNEDDMIHLLIVLREQLAKNGDIRLSKGYSVVKKSVDKAFREADEMLYADKATKR